MRTGIIGAIEEEIAYLRDLMSVESITEKAGMKFYHGRLEGKEVVLVQSGIGKVNGALCAQILIDSFAVEQIVFSGVAGAVSPQLKIGDIVISSDSMYHDVDVTAFGYLPGQVPRLGVRYFPAATKLITIAQEAAREAGNHGVFVGRVLTGDRFIAKEDEVRRLGTELKGMCVEMEGAGVGQACFLNNIPYVLIRCISDRADGFAPADFREFCLQAAQTAATVICGILRRL